MPGTLLRYQALTLIVASACLACTPNPEGPALPAPVDVVAPGVDASVNTDTSPAPDLPPPALDAVPPAEVNVKDAAIDGEPDDGPPLADAMHPVDIEAPPADTVSQHDDGGGDDPDTIEEQDLVANSDTEEADAGCIDCDTEPPPCKPGVPGCPCVSIRAIGPGLGGDGVGAVAVAVDTCETSPEPGTAVLGLVSADFSVAAAGEPAEAVVLDQAAEPLVTLLLDASPAAASALGAIKDEAWAIAVALPAGTRIRVVFYGQSLVVQQPWTPVQETTVAAIDALAVLDGPADPYGALIEALETSALGQAERMESMAYGVAPIGQIVVIAAAQPGEGSDAAAALAALAMHTDDVVAVAVAIEAQEMAVSVGTGSSFDATTQSAAGEVVDRLIELQERVYLVAACTSSSDWVVEVDGLGTSSALSLMPTTGLLDGPCTSAGLETACGGKACGGLYCGGCPGKGGCGDDLQCTCSSTHFAPPDCLTCATAFAGSDCDECAEINFTGPECDACSTQFTGPECTECIAGFGGPGCATDLDDCAAKPCQNDGACVDGIATFSCECLPGFDGEQCEVPPTDCAPNPCQHDGQCIETGVDTFECSCSFGYLGPMCQDTLAAVMLAMSSNLTCALLETGEVDCFGAPAAVFEPDELFVEIAGADGYICGVRQDDSGLSCWGTEEPAGLPAVPVDSLSGGGDGLCGLTGQGQVVCFGSPPEDPVNDVPDGTGYVQVVRGETHACARNADGEVVCWGNISALGYAEQDPTVPPFDDFIDIASGYYHLCGIREGGSLVCWLAYPQPPAWALKSIEDAPKEGEFTTLESGGARHHQCAIKPNGTAVCFGGIQWDWKPTPPPFGLYSALYANAIQACFVTVGGFLECFAKYPSPYTEPPQYLTPPETTVPPTCGNGAVDPGEACDGSTIACSELGDGLSGQTGCLATCLGWNQDACAACGDGTVDADEACEQGKTTTCSAMALYGVGNAVTCDSSCQWNTSACAPCNETLLGCPGGPDCEAGTCCDVVQKKFLPEGTACGDGALGVKTTCQGAHLATSIAVFGCTGSSPDCSTHPDAFVWTPYEVLEPCPADSFCAVLSDGAKCVPSECTSGPCCNTSTHAFRPKGYKCGSAASMTETQCAGNDIVERSGYEGCPGNSADCSQAADDTFWGPWQGLAECPGDATCVSNGGAPYCDGPTTCLAGGCCDPLTHTYQPKGEACTADAGDVVLRCEGQSVVGHRIVSGCDGTSPGCAAWPGLDVVIGPLGVAQTCSSSEVCVEWTLGSGLAAPQVDSGQLFAFTGAGCAKKTLQPNSAPVASGCYAGSGTSWTPKPGGACPLATPSYEVRCDGSKWQKRPLAGECTKNASNSGYTQLPGGGQAAKWKVTYSCEVGAGSGAWETVDDCGATKLCLQKSSKLGSGDHSCISKASGCAGQPDGKLCNTSSSVELWRCNDAANTIERRLGYPTCHKGACEDWGYNNNFWTGSWEAVKDCGQQARCEASNCGDSFEVQGWFGDLPEHIACEPIMSDYGFGGCGKCSACADCETGAPTASGTPCGGIPNKAESKCIGDEIWTRKASASCNGSGSCSPTKIVYSEWEYKSKCGSASTTCASIPALKTAYCKLVDDLSQCQGSCSSGAQCPTGSCIGGLCLPSLCQGCLDVGQSCDVSSSCSYLGCKSPPPAGLCLGLIAEIMQSGFSAGGIAISSMTVKYGMELFIGDPVVFGTYAWSSPTGGQTLPGNTTVWLHLNQGGPTYYIPIQPGVPPDGSGEFGPNTKSGFQWDELLCTTPAGGAPCLSETAAKAFWEDGFCVAGFTVTP